VHHGADPTDRLFRVDRRRALISIGFALVLAIGAIGLIGEVANYDRMAHALTEAHHVWLVGCLAGEALAYIGYIMAYRDVARVGDGPCLPVWTATRIVVVGFGAFVLGSTPGGLAVDYWALHRATGESRDAARRVLALNTLEWAVLGTFAFVSSAILLLGRADGVPLPLIVMWLLVMPVCTALALSLARPDRIERLTSAPRSRREPIHGLAIRRRARWVVVIAREGLGDALAGILVIRALLRDPVRNWAGVIGFGVYWAGDLLALYAGLRAFGIEVGPGRLIVAYTTGYMITALPLPAGGAGTTEATMAWMLNVVGVPFAPGLLAAVAYRVFAFWLPLFPALAFLPLTGGLADDLDRIRETRFTQ
jgi:P-type Mg2+ transporter